LCTSSSMTDEDETAHRSCAGSSTLRRCKTVRTSRGFRTASRGSVGPRSGCSRGVVDPTLYLKPAMKRL
jgi:hypothetical protein